MSDRPRGIREVRAAYDEYWAKVWWCRHQELKHTFCAAQLGESEPAAKRIEEKYGRENLVCDARGLALISSRLSALSWVLGAEWEESLDT